MVAFCAAEQAVRRQPSARARVWLLLLPLDGALEGLAAPQCRVARVQPELRRAQACAAEHLASRLYQLLWVFSNIMTFTSMVCAEASHVLRPVAHRNTLDVFVLYATQQ
jgi:hypothetical protein